MIAVKDAPEGRHHHRPSAVRAGLRLEARMKPVSIPSKVARSLPVAQRQAALALLEHEHLMTIAVLDPDGAPRVSTVGYLSQGLDLYFVTARDSAKHAAIRADPRVACAIRQEAEVCGDGLALSVSGLAREVLDPIVVERINQAARTRFSGGHLYCPQTSSVAVIQVRATQVVVARARGGRSTARAYRVGTAP